MDKQGEPKGEIRLNYIKELNAFYDWLELNELSSSAINLWYALMHINNKAGWAETFTVAESVLSVKTGLTDRTIRKCRNELKQKGLIDFVSRKGGKPPIYKIISFETGEIFSGDKKCTENISAVHVTEHVTGHVTEHVTDRSTLNKQNKTKQNETEKEVIIIHRAHDPFVFFESEGFGTVSGYISEKITFWCDELSDELVLESMKIAVETGNKNWKYCEAILKNWLDKGLKTVQDVKADQLAFKEQRAKQKMNSINRSKRQNRVEKLPEWLETRQRSTEDQDIVMNFEEEKKKMEERLKRYKKANQ